MWIFCLAEDSHVMSNIISSEKYKKKNILWKCRLPVVIGALRVKGGSICPNYQQESTLMEKNS